MAKTQNVYELVIGVDVSKAKLDGIMGSEGSAETVSNDAKEIGTLIQQQITNPNNTLVVVEATGDYERLLVDLLHESNIAIAVVNPRRIRDFAKGIGWDAKTDPIDAKLIAYYGEVVDPKPSVAKSVQEKELTSLVLRRRQLLKMITMESNRLGQAQVHIAKFIKESLEHLKTQVKTLDRLIASHVKQSAKNTRKVEIMQSVKGGAPSPSVRAPSPSVRSLRSFQSLATSIEGRLPSLLVWLRLKTIQVSTRANTRRPRGEARFVECSTWQPLQLNPFNHARYSFVCTT